MLMAKYLLIDKHTNMLLGVDPNVQLMNLLSKGLDGVVILRMDYSHPFYSQTNKTMMAGRTLTINSRLIIKDDTGVPFPEETLGKLEYVKLREPIMSRLFGLVTPWISQSVELIFPGMESIVEIELRDCDHSNNKYTTNIYFHAEMLGITAVEAYEQLNAIAARGQKKRMQGMSFIYKYEKMINNIKTVSDAGRINALMYQDWAMFQEKFTKEKS
jgi:hypothetical protein